MASKPQQQQQQQQPAAQRSRFQLYRKTTVGLALAEALDDLLRGDFIRPETAMEVLLQFDASMNAALAERVTDKLVVKGHLHTYRFCDGVWTFVVENAECRLSGRYMASERMKVVACDAKPGRPDIDQFVPRRQAPSASAASRAADPSS